MITAQTEGEPLPRPVRVMRDNADLFTAEFLQYLPDNLHVFDAFERESLRVVARGWKHYSARTIIHVLRHHSALEEVDGKGWKINDHTSPYLARLFVLMHPEHRALFEFREAKAVDREQQASA